MTYLVKSRTSGEISPVDASAITEESFATYEVYHATELQKDIFEEQMKKFQIVDIQMQQQILQKKLQDLMGQDQPVPPVGVPQKVLNEEGTIASTQSVSALESKIPQIINPKTNAPYTKEERDDLFVKFSEDMERTSEEIIFCENNGDHFVAVVAQKHHNFPKNVGGIPIVQMSEEEHMQMR